MNTKFLFGAGLLGVVAVVCASAGSVNAHHAFAAEFDPNRPVIYVPAGAGRQNRVGQPSRLDPRGGHQRRWDQRSVDGRGWYPEHPVTPWPDSGHD